MKLGITGSRHWKNREQLFAPNTAAYAEHVGLRNLTFVWTIAELRQFIRWCAHARSKRKRALFTNK